MLIIGCFSTEKSMRLTQLSSIQRLKRTTRFVLALMLLQLFSPVAFSLTGSAEKTGHFSVVCTTQGYQTVWIESNSTKQPLELFSSAHCPYCLLNEETDNADLYALSAAVTLAVQAVELSVLADSNTQLTDIYLNLFPIRAPPGLNT